MSGNDPKQESPTGLSALFFPLLILWDILRILLDRIFLGGYLEKKRAEKRREQFAREIQEGAPSLFAEFSGRVVPNFEDYGSSFDFAAVTVAIDDMLLLFTRGRGEFGVEVTPAKKPTAWREIGTLVRSSSRSQDTSQRLEYSGIEDFALFFRENIETIRYETSKADWRAPRRWLRPI